MTLFNQMTLFNTRIGGKNDLVPCK